MSSMRARVENRRLDLDTPTELPAGTAADLVVDDEGERDQRLAQEISMQFLEPWMPAGPNALKLQQELALEVGGGHPLKGRNMQAIAVRRDCDDVLFVSIDEPKVVAVVHLTYARRPEPDPRWPSTTFFASMEDWFERGMQPDHDDFTT